MNGIHMYVISEWMCAFGDQVTRLIRHSMHRSNHGLPVLGSVCRSHYGPAPAPQRPLVVHIFCLKHQWQGWLGHMNMDWARWRSSRGIGNLETVEDRMLIMELDSDQFPLSTRNCSELPQGEFNVVCIRLAPGPSPFTNTTMNSPNSRRTHQQAPRKARCQRTAHACDRCRAKKYK